MSPRKPSAGGTVIGPLLLSQRTSLQVLGWTARRYLAFVKKHDVRHARDGRIVICRTADILSVLGLSDEAPEPAAAPEWHPSEIVRALHAGGGRR